MKRSSKKQEEHQWIAMITLDITEEDAKEIMETGVPPLATAHNKSTIYAGCYKCEKQVEEVLGKPCTGMVE